MRPLASFRLFFAVPGAPGQNRRFFLSPSTFFGYSQFVKTVGRRRTSDDPSPISPHEAFARAIILQKQADRLNPYPRPRGFVYKAKTREEYERWRKSQPNPRLW